jgi:hypothetical protein
VADVEGGAEVVPGGLAGGVLAAGGDEGGTVTVTTRAGLLDEQAANRSASAPQHAAIRAGEPIMSPR